MTMSAHRWLRQGLARNVELVPMTPLEQVRAGRLTHRVVQLLAGLVLFGISMGLLLRATLGLEPWGVFHYGLLQHLPLTYGQVTILVSFVVLLLWIPLRQWPGLGTLLNSIIIGLALDLAGSGPTGESGGSSAYRLVSLLVQFAVGPDLAAALAAHPGPVLLVDDLADSRWSLTVAARALRRAGAPAVLPLTLALSG